MNKFDPNNVEQDLREFPDHKLSQSSQEKIHQNVMASIQNVEKTKRRGTVMKKTMATIASVAALVLFIMLGANTFLNNNENTGEGNLNANKSPVQENQEEQQPTEFTKSTAKKAMKQYRQSFVTIADAANQDGLITGFESTSDIMSHFTEVMSEDLASWMVDSYLKEESDGIYFIAKDGPTWLAEDKEFTIEQVNNDHYKIIQERDNELLGNIEMIFHSKLSDGDWIISEIDSKELGANASTKKQEQTNPDTSIEEKAQTILQAINNRNAEVLANHVHSEKGLLFSPYVFVEEDAVVIKKTNARTMLDDNQEYLFGQFDGSGKPIEMTISEYFEEFLSIEALLDPDEILVDQPKQRGNTINNIKEVFPDAKVVEFYQSGSEEYEGMDWSSVNLVFEQNQDGVWKLVAIVKDQWTI
ncbi:hypothetical protein [Aquibacillus saliphilus]|uniref:hypothetical protein n=1 Tax=Aquibacillus saliphilus TaxID=1909422 RepID=UPI001CF03F52|nr:hypothetical protein [Aquibacillus saliphilus]